MPDMVSFEVLTCSAIKSLKESDLDFFFNRWLQRISGILAVLGFKESDLEPKWLEPKLGPELGPKIGPELQDPFWPDFRSLF